MEQGLHTPEGMPQATASPRGTSRLTHSRTTWRRLTSATCLLLLCAVLGISLWFAHRARRYGQALRSHYVVTAVLRDSLATTSGDSLAAALARHPFADTAAYVSVAARERILRDSGGADSTRFAAANPLPPLVTVRLKTRAARTDSLAAVTAALSAHPEVESILTAPDMLKMEEEYIPLAVRAVYVLLALIVVLALTLGFRSVRRLVGHKQRQTTSKTPEEDDSAAPLSRDIPEDA